MVEIPDSMLERWIRATEENAKANTEIAILTRDLRDVNRDVLIQMRQQTADIKANAQLLLVADDERQANVEKVTAHVTQSITDMTAAFRTSFINSDFWWRRALWFAVGLVALASVVGAGLEKLLGLLH